MPHKFSFLSRAALLMTLVLLAACATAGHERATRTTTSMTEAKPALEKMKTQIAITLGTLNSLIRQKSEDPRPQYNSYAKELQKMEAQAKTAYNSVRETKANGDVYFKAWEKDLQLISNPDIRDRSAARRIKAMEDFNKILVKMDAADEAFYPFLLELQDVQKYLNHDLTPEGILSIKDVVVKAGKDASNINQRIDATIAELHRVENAMEINRNLAEPPARTSAKPRAAKPSNM
jgi:predicted  nucleic acid-binding Zn-ribbon protein